MRQQRSIFRRHPDFFKLWAGQTVSLFGSQIGGLAASLTAVLALGATAGQVGLLRAASFAPNLLLGLFVGVWVDRVRRRPILIAADLASALLVASIPLAASLGLLGIAQLYIVNFLAGTVAVFSRVADGSYLPALVGREELIDANGKLEVSRSAAQIGGPGLAGVLIELLTAPAALVFDAVSFLVSALFLGAIRTTEPASPSSQTRRSVVGEIGEGLRLVGRNPLLRAIAGSAGLGNFFGNVGGAVFVLYLTRELRLEPVTVGLIFGAIGPGALLGSLLAARLPRRFGLGRTLVGAALVLYCGGLLPALAGGPVAPAVATLVAAQFSIGFGAVILNVNTIGLSQAITPDHLLGRLRATTGFITAGAMPLGALAGGALGGAIGLWPTLLVGGIGGFLGFFWVLLSPLRSLREQPAPRAAAPAADS